jgi:propanol-preferring alcohol dehydrogenase
MQAMVLRAPRQPLEATDMAVPQAGPGQVLLQVRACAVCRTDLHVVDGELPKPKLPLIPGHEIVGVVVARGSNAARFQIGERVGVPWLGGTCGRCDYCRSERENLCDQPLFTGYSLDGGYAQYTVADERFCFSLPDSYPDAEAAPLLCAGLIGYRSLVRTGDAKRIGIFGFGAAAHIITQVARFLGREIYAFTKPGDRAGQQFALEMGARWAGDSLTAPPEALDAAIIFAPAGELVPTSLKVVRKGGLVVCGCIHMSDVPSFPYQLLWEERAICSIANLTRRDGDEFFALARQVPLHTSVQTFPLTAANDALARLRAGRIKGAAVLVP